MNLAPTLIGIATLLALQFIFVRWVKQIVGALQRETKILVEKGSKPMQTATYRESNDPYIGDDGQPTAAWYEKMGKAEAKEPEYSIFFRRRLLDAGDDFEISKEGRILFYFRVPSVLDIEIFKDNKRVELLVQDLFYARTSRLLTVPPSWLEPDESEEDAIRRNPELKGVFIPPGSQKPTEKPSEEPEEEVPAGRYGREII